MTTPIAIEGKGDAEDIVFETEQELMDKMSEIIGKKKVEDWVAERLESLREYVLERDTKKQTVSLEDVNGKQDNEK